MKKEIIDFLNKCNNTNDLCINKAFINNTSFTVVYLIDMVDIKSFNYEVKPYINKKNIDRLDELFVGLCQILDDYSNDNLNYLLYSGRILFFSENNNYYFEFINKPKRTIGKNNLDPDDGLNSNDGLIEDLNTNITLIKKRIKSNDLIVKKYKLGLLTKTDCAIMYLNDNYNKNELINILKHIESLNKENVISINDITYQLQNNQLIPSVFLSSSPEVISLALLKGRIAIMIDHSHIACIAPATFSTFTISKSYLNTPKYYTIFNHLFLILFIFIAIFMMGLFIALINFHSNMLSTSFLSNLKITERGTSWPMFYEVLIVYFLFEFYRFATSRSPNNYIQNIIIILGGLFIGQNAIESGTIGATILFLTSISYIAVFAITNNIYLITSINIFRLFILVLSYLMGIIGFLVSSIITIFYFYKPSNNSTYYLYPFIPFNIKSFINFFKPNIKYDEVTYDK